MPGGAWRWRGRSPRRRGTTGERDDVVELPDALELLGGDELLQEARAGERPFRELRQRPLSRLRVRRAPQHEAERRIDELLVGGRSDGDVLAQPGVDPAHAYS